MKTIFTSIMTFIILVVAALLGVTYYVTRPKDKKSADLAFIKNLPSRAWNGVKTTGQYFRNLFASHAVIDPDMKAAA